MEGPPDRQMQIWIVQTTQRFPDAFRVILLLLDSHVSSLESDFERMMIYVLIHIVCLKSIKRISIMGVKRKSISSVNRNEMSST